MSCNTGKSGKEYSMIIEKISVVRMTFIREVWDLVIIDTKDGVRGWGEITGSMNIEGVAAIIETMGTSLQGKDATNRLECLHALTRWSYPSKLEMRTYMTALSGVDQALWDLYAKGMGVPLHVAYGAKGVDSIPLYANLNKALRKDRDEAILAEHGRKAYEEGFSIIKCTPFDESEPNFLFSDLSNAFNKIKALTDHVDIGHIAIDCHRRFARSSLDSMLTALIDQCGIPFWIEDCLDVAHQDELPLFKARYPQFRFAGGEDAFTTHELKKLIDWPMYDVIMPDVKYVGGPSVLLPFMCVAERSGTHVSLHNPNGLVATAHSAHLSALLHTGMPMEFPYRANIGRADLANPTEAVVQGAYHFNGEAGIGVEITKEALKEYGRTYSTGSWKPIQG